MGGVRLVLSHPCDKNRCFAWMGLPGWLVEGHALFSICCGATLA